MKKVIQKQSYHYRFHPPVIPQDQWCDFRTAFESGMTLKDIGLKFHCDQRTVRQCIILNKDSSYHSAITALKKANKEFPTSDSYYREFRKAFKNVPTVYDRDFYSFLTEKYGKITIDEPDW